MIETRQPVTVGTSLPRQDGPDKITGRARYAGDQVLPGMLYARLVLSPYAHARILNIDMSPALAVPGVVAVFTAETLGMAEADTLSRVQSPLAVDEVVWCGHPVAIVVGETEASAEDGTAAVEVDYEPLPAVIDPEAAIRADSPLTRSDNEKRAVAGEVGHTTVPQEGVKVEEEERSQNVSQTPPLRVGDIESGLREAEVVVECSYRTHPVHQSYMEPQSVTVAPSSSGHQLVIWPSTQGMFNVRSAVSHALKMPERQIRVEPVPIG
ncbi:MAG TPA: molybdopterin cofactor-binding domain-containing protein, partial [Ktedonobacteraceae bacterium]|nr:molybdopterin cofactor-binding domain-containing protein [Ktedonobacteraceae bacterium]